eukprot:3695183-Rhodomonas_salina.1
MCGTGTAVSLRDARYCGGVCGTEIQYGWQRGTAVACAVLRSSTGGSATYGVTITGINVMC